MPSESLSFPPQSQTTSPGITSFLPSLPPSLFSFLPSFLHVAQQGPVITLLCLLNWHLLYDSVRLMVLSFVP